MGEVYASYNVGNEYTSGVSADIITTGDQRIAAYSVTSPDVNVYKAGTAVLQDGKASVSFDKDFIAMISGSERPVITITPIGECNGVHLVSISNTGFVVAENGNGTSSVEFTWIAVGKRVDAQKAGLPTALADKNFDLNLKGVMFNEGNTEAIATPIWWDGSQIRFDENMPKLKRSFSSNRVALPSSDAMRIDNSKIKPHVEAVKSKK
jgi:hypothetical protein